MNNKEDDFMPMSSAPKDGTPIKAKIQGHGSDNIIAWYDGLLDSYGNDCCSWMFIEDSDPPPSWTDGICWDSNEDGEKSAEPIGWKPMPKNKD